MSNNYIDPLKTEIKYKNMSKAEKKAYRKKKDKLKKKVFIN
ncbi:hypothetical protein [Mycoplasma struthionis]|nr:hypothetical protein [Mycoplasma struthionis]